MANEDLDSQGRSLHQDEFTKHGKAFAKVRGVCTCHQGPDGETLVDPDCPLHGHLHRRDDNGKLVDARARIRIPYVPEAPARR